MLTSAEARVSRVDLRWVDIDRGVQGTIWFTGCLSDGCMIYPVTIHLVARKGKERIVLASVTIMPGLEGFPVDGLLTPNGDRCPRLNRYELGINVVSSKYPTGFSQGEYFRIRGKYLH